MKTYQATMIHAIILLMLIICSSEASAGFLAGALENIPQKGSVVELGNAMVSQSQNYTMLELIQRDEVYKAELLEEDAPLTLSYLTSFLDERETLFFNVQNKNKKTGWCLEILQGATAFYLDGHNDGVQKEIWMILNPDDSFIHVCVWELGGTKSSICITKHDNDGEFMDFLMPYSDFAYYKIYGAIKYFINEGFISTVGKYPS